jgi:hypothetical protein
VRAPNAVCFSTYITICRVAHDLSILAVRISKAYEGAAFRAIPQARSGWRSVFETARCYDSVHMARFKPARGRKPVQQRPNAIGCILVLVLLFALMYAVMYFAVKPG